MSVTIPLRLWATASANRRTGGHWERQGVVPDLPGGDDPLFVAREHLRRQIAEP